jgi:cytochrome c556
MKKLVILAALVAAAATASLAHEGHEHATGVVRERMELMTDMGHRLVAISKRLRANNELNRIPDDVRAIHDLAAKILPLFPAGSNQYPTAAKPELWKNPDDFKDKAKALEIEAEKLTQTSIADGKALRDQFRAVAFACDACHDKYRMTGRK